MHNYLRWGHPNTVRWGFLDFINWGNLICMTWEVSITILWVDLNLTMWDCPYIGQVGNPEVEIVGITQYGNFIHLTLHLRESPPAF
jgi:hypothetical protein